MQLLLKDCCNVDRWFHVDCKATDTELELYRTLKRAQLLDVGAPRLRIEGTESSLERAQLVLVAAPEAPAVAKRLLKVTQS